MPQRARRHCARASSHPADDAARDQRLQAAARTTEIIGEHVAIDVRVVWVDVIGSSELTTVDLQRRFALARPASRDGGF
jgi:hypothetical protein